MNRRHALVESLKRLQSIAMHDLATPGDVENALNEKGIRVLSYDPLRLEWARKDVGKGPILPTPSPTLLFSPHGLGILEALFAKTPAELSDYRSMLEFARENGLSQSKLSLFTTTFRALDLIDLRAKLAELPLETWVHAIDYPNTKKGLTPFFETARAYALPDGKKLKPGQVRGFFDAYDLLEGEDWYPGPNDQDFTGLTLVPAESFWVTENAERKLKKHLKLVPAVFKSLDSAIYLARPKKDFRKEAIVSPSPNAEGRPNRFRTVWDLLRGEARLREVGIQLLKKVLAS